ncbi:hypothetical protein [Chromobacterium haemolyticum]|uniref:hypothetical protein n=1 Tax=Chromobacterium haemolyticum TaxID=394935 RepID=UPI00307D0CF1
MTNQDATNVFETQIFPAFEKEYNGIEKPTDFFIDTNNLDIDGAGAPGVVVLSQGACNQADYFVYFAIAHETAHGVVALEHKKQGSHCPEAMDVHRKKHEAWADLIATKVLITRLPHLWTQVQAYIDLMPNILGDGTDSHPSGTKRIELMKEFIKSHNRVGAHPSTGLFSKILCCCAKKSTSTEDVFKSAFKKIETENL